MKIRTALPGLVLLLLLSGCWLTGGLLEDAREAADAGDRPRAIDLYTRYLLANPDDYDVRVEYTLLLGEQWAAEGGARAPVLDNLELLWTERPSNEKVRQLFAMMLVREGQAAREARRYEEAEEFLFRAVDVNPDVGTAHYHLGLLYEQWGRPNDSFGHLVAAASKRPRIPDLYLRLGTAYLQRGELDRSINTLGLVLELQGTSTYLIPRAHCTLALAYMARGDRREALDHRELGPDDCQVDGLTP